MKVNAISTPRFEGGEDLFQVFLDTKTELNNGDVLVITSKIVALAQNRLVQSSNFGNNEKEALENLIQQEADKVYPGRYTFTMKDGFLIPFAGIDASNVPEGTFVLWPKDSYEVCKELHQKLCDHFQIENLGVVISDSGCRPLRWGVSGFALAWYGFVGVEDIRGEKDLFGRELEISRKAVADNLATAAMVVQGEGDECTPFALVQGAPVSFAIVDDFLENSHIDPDEDIFKEVMDL